MQISQFAFSWLFIFYRVTGSCAKCCRLITQVPSLVWMPLEKFVFVHVSYKITGTVTYHIIVQRITRTDDRLIETTRVFTTARRFTEQHCAPCFIHTATWAADLVCACLLLDTCGARLYASVGQNSSDLIPLRARSTFWGLAYIESSLKECGSCCWVWGSHSGAADVYDLVPLRE